MFICNADVNWVYLMMYDVCECKSTKNKFLCMCFVYELEGEHSLSSDQPTCQQNIS